MSRSKVEPFSVNPAALWPCLAICSKARNKKPPQFCTSEISWNTCMMKSCEFLGLELEDDSYVVKKEATSIV